MARILLDSVTQRIYEDELRGVPLYVPLLSLANHVPHVHVLQLPRTMAD